MTNEVLFHSVLLTTAFLISLLCNKEMIDNRSLLEKSCREDYEAIKSKIKRSIDFIDLMVLEMNIMEFQKTRKYKRLSKMQSYCAELHACIKNQKQRLINKNLN